VILSLTTCGIETVTTLQPPLFTNPSNNLLSLTHNTSNSDSNSLKGYEIYYRAFQTQTNADAARTAIEQATATTTSSPETVLALMVSSGFTRMYDANGYDGANGTRPLFAVASSEITTAVTYQLILDSTIPPSFDVTLSGSPAPSSSVVSYWYYTRSPSYSNLTSASKVAVSRSISTPSSPVSFESTYSPTDVDYNGTTGEGPSSPFFYVFFAVAYGLDTSSGSFSFLYSFPTSLYTSIAYTLPSNVQ
jgi:hypothetical protein